MSANIFCVRESGASLYLCTLPTFPFNILWVSIMTCRKLKNHCHWRVEPIEILVLRRVCLRCYSKHFGRIKTLVKILLVSTLDRVIYYKGTFLQDSTKPLLAAQKFAPFFNVRLLCSTKISMVKPDLLETFHRDLWNALETRAPPKNRIDT
jgi:hypothetical protein